MTKGTVGDSEVDSDEGGKEGRKRRKRKGTEQKRRRSEG